MFCTTSFSPGHSPPPAAQRQAETVLREGARPAMLPARLPPVWIPSPPAVLTGDDGSGDVLGAVVDGAARSRPQRKVGQLDGLRLGRVVQGGAHLGSVVAVRAWGSVNGGAEGSVAAGLANRMRSSPTTALHAAPAPLTAALVALVAHDADAHQVLVTHCGSSAGMGQLSVEGG